MFGVWNSRLFSSATLLIFGALVGFGLAGLLDGPPPISTPLLGDTSAPETQAVANGGGSELDAEIEQLRAIGYLGEAHAEFDQTGVVRSVRDRVQPGINLYNPSHAAEAYLIDLEGRVLHRWALSLDRAFPAGPEPNERNRYWRRVRGLDNGDLLAIYEGVGLIRIDKDSRLLWARQNGAHHDMNLTSDGQLVVITRKAHVNPEIHPINPVLEDFLEILDPESGESVAELSLYWAFANSRYASVMGKRKPDGDIFHTNSLQLLDGRHSSEIPAFALGNLLVSIRELSTIAVIDFDKKQVVWSLSGQWVRQHEAQLLDNGNILLFDNQGDEAGSKVIEFDPRTQQVRWLFHGDPESPLYSETMGSQQRLANGNTLITESNAGRVREVTAEGEEVWLFHSPHRLPSGEAAFGGVARICDMQRLERAAPPSWLEAR